MISTTKLFKDKPNLWSLKNLRVLIYPKFNTREKSYDYLLIIYMQKFEGLFLLNLSALPVSAYK